MRIHIAKDMRTEFPVVRAADAGLEWVGLLPVTKLQVETWMTEGGMLAADDEDVKDFQRRLELQEDFPEYPYQFAEKLRRVEPSRLTAENMAGVLATHLSLWTNDDDLAAPGITFPSRHSEWGRILRWLGARVVASREWKRTLNTFQHIATRDLLRAVLAQKIAWPENVAAILEALHQCFPASERGLPFMRLGIYEVTADRRRLEKVAAKQETRIFRPVAAGQCRIWPALEGTGETEWQTILQPALPMLGVRAWFSEAHVLEAHQGANSRMVDIGETRPGHQTHPALPLRRHAAPNGYVRNWATMVCRCPICYKALKEKEAQLFRPEKTFWCYKELVPGQESTASKHSEVPPSVTAAVQFLESVNQDYLQLAADDPVRVRSVTLSGHSQTGKGTLLLSLAGLMQFPQGRNMFSQAFPKEDDWEFGFYNCSAKNWRQTEHNINLIQQVEEMWVDGDLPPPTAALRQALRCPWFFYSEKKGFLGRRRHAMAAIFNDIAGEVVEDPAALARNEHFTHVASSTDVIYLVPADNIKTGATHLNGFATGLGGLPFEDRALDLEKINLILVINRIDKVRHSDERGLIDVCLRAPYMLPDSRDEGELSRYLRSMMEVHHDLEAWMEANFPDLSAAARRFGSVRYCALSATGFEAINRGNKPGTHWCLPFQPHPVRVADPLLWLLLENGLLSGIEI
jgi:hypothetical protein